MKSTGLYIIVFLLCTLQAGLAQPMSKEVTFVYQNQRLEDVLEDLTARYDVRFAYSREMIPVDQEISVRVKEKPLHAALDDLFAYTPVVYAPMAGQVMLRTDRNKRVIRLSKLEPAERKVQQMSPIHPPTASEALLLAQLRQEREKYTGMAPIRNDNAPKEIAGGKREETKLDDYRLPTFEYDGAQGSDRRLAQISVFSSVGTNLQKSIELTNHVSVNLLWGKNGGVEGLEVGGLMNKVTQDVKGLQIAGMANKVDGNTIGTQAAGLFNIGKGQVKGMQAAGVFNVSGETDAVQSAGLFNISRDFAGVQLAGFFNIAKGKSNGVQLAAFFNYSREQTGTQMSTLFNIGGDVRWGQASTLLNVGKNVSGFQFGLINVADTVSGSSIGLLNIVKKGYNRVEFSGGEALHANVGLKLGSHNFYNIFHFGAHWDDQTLNNSGAQQDVSITWGLGYGFGSALRLGARSLLNVEAVAIHINEGERWTDQLNLLNQLRFLLDVRVARRTSIFAGPVGNLMISKLYDPDTDHYGSTIMPYTLYDETNNGTNVKMWVGFNAGIRF